VSAVGYAVIAGAVLLASCLQASVGFGIGMVAAPVVAIVDPRLIPGTLIMLATLVTLIVTVRERDDIDLRGTGWVPAARRRNVVIAGATSGRLGTATSIGGPPVALVWQRNSGARLRGTMAGFPRRLDDVVDRTGIHRRCGRPYRADFPGARPCIAGRLRAVAIHQSSAGPETVAGARHRGPGHRGECARRPTGVVSHG
jgi:hypothetical protein